MIHQEIKKHNSIRGIKSEDTKSKSGWKGFLVQNQPWTTVPSKNGITKTRVLSSSSEESVDLSAIVTLMQNVSLAVLQQSQSLYLSAKLEWDNNAPWDGFSLRPKHYTWIILMHTPINLWKLNEIKKQA